MKPSGVALIVAAITALLAANAAFAAPAIVRDGDTIQLGDTTYQLDGIDAPELDQICIDDHADPWTCGLEARDHLVKLIADREVSCEDLGLVPYRKRHLGLCTVKGEDTSLNQLAVRQGFAVTFDPHAKELFKADEAAAKNDRRGLWKGCFAAPADFRQGRKSGALLGDACRADKDREIRAVLFPEFLVMPPGCPIKGKLALRARVTGNVGVYHLQGCRSYPALTHPDRWFCSEEDAQAAGFRKAYNCGSAGKKPL